MRRNRKKLHLELRLRAEARKAERQLRRQQKRRDRERSQQAVAVLRARRTPSPASAFEAEWPGIRYLLQLAGVEPAVEERVLRLCRALSGPLPTMIDSQWLPWMLLLSIPEWVRPVERLVLRGGSFRRKKEAVALHLLARYPVPPFLLRSLEVEPLPVARVPHEDRWAVDVLTHVGAGHSLRSLVGTEAFPTPLTRQMCHLFLDATADTEPVAALRRAQVAGFGGPRALADRLLATRAGDLLGPDEVVGEPGLHRIIGWLCRRPGLHDAAPEVLDDVIAWALGRGRESRGTFSLEGRTEASLLREVARWRVGRQLDEDPTGALPDAGVAAWADGDWGITQLVRRRELWEEGEHMRHCVAMYANLTRKRKVAIFSLRRADERVATIEVALGAGAVVQAKGRANRPLDADEARVIREWAAWARYAIRSW